MAAGAGGLAGGAAGLAATGGIDGRAAAGMGGLGAPVSGGFAPGMPLSGGLAAGAPVSGGLAPGAPVSGGLAAGGIEGLAPGAAGAAGRAAAGGAAGLGAPAGGGRDIIIVLPAAPGTAAGLGAAAGAAGRAAAGAPGGLGGAAPAGAAGLAAAAARGLARICFTCSISLPESNGLGMCPLAPTAIALAGSIGVPPPSSSTGTSLMAASWRTFWHSSYPPRPGMLTSARIRSGFEDLAAWNAALPSLTVVSFTSSRANVMLTACWMVLESSARSRFLGMRARPPGDFNVYKVPRAEASFARASGKDDQ